MLPIGSRYLSGGGGCWRDGGCEAGTIAICSAEISTRLMGGKVRERGSWEGRDVGDWPSQSLERLMSAAQQSVCHG